MLSKSELHKIVQDTGYWGRISHEYQKQIEEEWSKTD